MQMFIRKLFLGLGILSLVFLSTGCRDDKKAIIADDFEKFTSILDAERDKEIIGMSKEVSSSFNQRLFSIKTENSLQGKFKGNNTDEAKKWIKDNQQAISEIVDRAKKTLDENLMTVGTLSKSAYEETSTRGLILKYALTYYRLISLKLEMKNAAEALLPLAFIVHSPSLNSDEETLGFRTDLETKILQFLGSSIVVDKDIERVKSILKDLGVEKNTSVEIKNILAKTNSDMISITKKLRSQYNLKEASCGEECTQIKKDFEVINKQFESITFLYTPGQKYFVLTRLLTVVGNLTWGLCNTLIGAGVVLTTMIVSPFTDAIDFPSFAIARNGMQFYVDVSGMSPIAGKMSLGLFELSNYAGLSFASDHEGGHGIQSAVLGPLYLPTIIADYIISGYSYSLMENLAWQASYASDQWL